MESSEETSKRNAVQVVIDKIRSDIHHTLSYYQAGVVAGVTVLCTQNFYGRLKWAMYKRKHPYAANKHTKHFKRRKLKKG